ncbi:MAG: hypothetical protein JWM14_2322 [Chitinophagaceae bacterium]|nr:hypothetical protein [Chitinophagaceae bacterium]
MKKLRFLLLSALSLFVLLPAQAQLVTIPDANFRAFLETNYPTCMVGGQLDITCDEVVNETYLLVRSLDIEDMTGVEYFTNVFNLDCVDNKITNLSTLPPHLQILNCGSNNLSTLPTLPESLTFLDCGGNKITSFPHLPNSINFFDCEDNGLTTLPDLPTGLKNFWCNSNPLTAIASFPPNMESIDVGQTPLTSLPALPATLKQLSLNETQIAELPALPPALEDIFCGRTPLTTVPELPSSIRRLYIAFNAVTHLPALPEGLEILDIQVNQVTSLPALPSTLKQLHCTQNRLTYLPPLNEGLESLWLSTNQLVELPALPSTLKELDCTSNQLTCVPFLPSGLTLLSVADNFVTCLPNIPANPSLVYYPQNISVCEANSVNSCTVYPAIKGIVFSDDNQNNTQDSEENGLPFAKLIVQPGNYVVNADSAGNYKVNVELGTYSVQVDQLYYTSTPVSRSVTFTDFATESNGNDFALYAPDAIHDMAVVITPLSPARPGRSIGYAISYINRGTTVQQGTVNFTHDPLLTFDSAENATAADQTLTWSFATLTPGQFGTVYAYFTLPTTAQLGDSLTLTAAVIPLTEDQTPDDNSVLYKQAITSSFDPNYKEVSAATNISLSAVAEQDPFVYTVHFQNTGSDTAFVVTVKDTISTNFELLKIETIAASHAYTMQMKNGAAAWTFSNIDLPDSTTDEKRSHGFVKYKVVPKNTLHAGDEIRNTAHIFFDYNAPVGTNTTYNRIAMPAATQQPTSKLLSVYPNPGKGIFNVSVNKAVSGTWEVLNASGNTVLSVTQTAATEHAVIDISKEAKGLYILQFVNDEGVWREKIILN